MCKVCKALQAMSEHMDSKALKDFRESPVLTVRMVLTDLLVRPVLKEILAALELLDSPETMVRKARQAPRVRWGELDPRGLPVRMARMLQRSRRSRSETILPIVYSLLS